MKCKYCKQKVWWIYRKDLGWFKRCLNEESCPERTRIAITSQKLLEGGEIALYKSKDYMPVYKKSWIFGEKILINPK